jgi:phosphomannomutase
MKVLAISDYAARKRRETGGATTDLALPKTNMVVFELEGSSRVIARPSGTEPKVKFYVDVREDVKPGEAFDAAEKRAAAAMQALSDAFVKLAGV